MPCTRRAAAGGPAGPTRSAGPARRPGRGRRDRRAGRSSAARPPGRRPARRSHGRCRRAGSASPPRLAVGQLGVRSSARRKQRTASAYRPRRWWVAQAVPGGRFAGPVAECLQQGSASAQATSAGSWSPSWARLKPTEFSALAIPARWPVARNSRQRALGVPERLPQPSAVPGDPSEGEVGVAEPVPVTPPAL